VHAFRNAVAGELNHGYEIHKVLVKFVAINLLFDISVFYSEKLTHQDAKITFILMGRIFVSYILFLSMRRAHRIPQGRDKWNIFLPFKKSQRT